MYVNVQTLIVQCLLSLVTLTCSRHLNVTVC